MLAGTAIVLGGCVIPPKRMASEAECIEKTGDAEGCKVAVEQARKEHEQKSPKFSSLSECEQKHGSGKCSISSSSGGGSAFVPNMNGFWLGYIMGNNGQRAFTSEPYYELLTYLTANKVQSSRPTHLTRHVSRWFWW